MLQNNNPKAVKNNLTNPKIFDCDVHKTSVCDMTETQRKEISIFLNEMSILPIFGMSNASEIDELLLFIRKLADSFKKEPNKKQNTAPNVSAGGPEQEFKEKGEKLYLYFPSGAVHVFIVGQGGVDEFKIWPDSRTCMVLKNSEMRFYSGVQYCALIPDPYEK